MFGRGYLGSAQRTPDAFDSQKVALIVALLPETDGFAEFGQEPGVEEPRVEWPNVFRFRFVVTLLYVNTSGERLSWTTQQGPPMFLIACTRLHSGCYFPIILLL